MAHEDERGHFLLARVLALFDPQPGDEAGLDYVTLLWRLQALNSQPAYPESITPMVKPLPEPTTDEEERALREALAYYAPQPEDRDRERTAIALRLLEVIDRELFTWASALVQERSPTGVAVLPGTPLPGEP